MKLLKRMLLIKWYYIEHQIINFDTVNFMTGKNGSGKSTIIDAMQIVMLGSTRGDFFNKAANDKNGRTLDGYLKGEISDDGDIGFKTKRSGRFTSYIALEFFDTVERKYFTCGIVFDCYKDAPTDHMFFILNDKIPDNHFIDEETNIAMDYKKLKAYFAKNYTSSKYTTYKESNKAYQNDFLAKMGSIKPKFFTLFKKSVTFKPIDDIEKFISEYVCDVTNEIDIEKMKDNIRQYKELEKRAEEMQIRIVELEKIENLFKSYQKDVSEEYMQSFLHERSNLEIENRELQRLQKEVQNNQDKIKELGEKNKILEQQINELNEIKNKKEKELIASDINQKYSELKTEIQRLTANIQKIDDMTQQLINSFRNKIAKWRVNILALLDNKNKIENQEMTEEALKLKDNLEYLLSVNENNIMHMEENVLAEIKGQMENINAFANKMYFMKEQKEKELEERKDILEQEISNLKTGIKPYKKELITFKQKIEEELKLEFHENVNVEILADLLEIKDVKWKDAIECYLNHQMFYLIIEPKYYETASEIYREMARENKIFGFGIVDIENIQKLQIKIEPNSLAEEIQTNNQLARSYIDYLLGRVIKCEKTADLRKHKTSITPDCMLYKNYVLRKLVDRNHEFNFIGKNSIEEQIRIKTQEKEDIQNRLPEIKTIKNITKELKNAENFSNDEIKYISENMKEIQERPKLLEKREKCETEYNSLDLTWLNKVEGEIKVLEEKIKTLRDENTNNTIEASKLEALTGNMQNEKIPETERRVNAVKTRIETMFLENWCNEFGNPRFDEEIKTKKVETIRRRAENSKEEIKERKEKKINEVINARSDYNAKYILSYNVTDSSSNKEYSEEFEKMKQIELPNYIEKIKDSKEKAYEQFREDFISKLKANIDEVKTQIEELNDALKTSKFGVDQYHFQVKPKNEYKNIYEMITDDMLMEGQNLWSEAFNQKYSNEIKELFSKLTSSDIHDETYQKNVSIYTDYKTYLSFDLLVTNESGETQRLSRTLDKKSGGETQTPFYISVLASFAQLYRINKNRTDNTLRLIVFDEAFNKMDEERMKESLKLLPKFGFQAIIAAPSEKAGEIIPLVPNTLCVIRKGTNTVVREWKKGDVFDF